MRRLLLLACVALIPTVGTSALAGPPAAIPDGGQERANRAFESFAQQWMGKMQKAERSNRSKPKIESGGQYTYRGYATDFETELKPTGHPSAPYVGVLRYRENLYACSDRKATRCSVAASTPVTEIFRYQGGRWVY